MRIYLANGFVERGLMVDLVLTKDEERFLPEVSPKVRVVDLNRGWALTSVPGLARYLRRERPRVLLANGPHMGLAAICTKAIAGVPTRLVVREGGTRSISSRHGKRWIERTLPILVRLFYPMADRFVSVSDGVGDDLSRTARIPRARITTIYSPVVTPWLLAKAEEPLDHPWFEPNQPPVVLGVGRLTRQKDFPTLIKAFSLVQAKRSARLMILGEGRDRPQLQELVKKLKLEDQISMPGFEPNPYKFMAHAGVFALSSAWEGLANVMVEALACRCPVVSTDCPSGPAEVLDGSRYGRLVPVGDERALAEAIIAVLESPPKREMPRFIAERFGLKAGVEKYLEVLTE